MPTPDTYQSIALEDIHESTLNPRRHFDPKGMEELTASIKTHGVMTPIHVRKNAKGYELAAGHRRLRAAKAAGLTEIPAIVKDLTDQEFLEELTIENLQRSDLHALEEAAGYRALLDAKPKDGPKYDVERIAERVGKSVKYVYDRMKLLALIKPAQTLFLEDRFTTGHAILIARLKPEEQKRIIDPENHRDGLWEGQKSLLHDPNDESDLDDPYADLKPVSVRELEGHIADHVRFDAEKVDPILFPGTVAELKNAREQEEKIVKITHESFVQPEARDAKERTYCCSSWERADGQDDSKTCDYSVTGVIVVGFGRGEAFKVCVNKDKCLVHWGARIRAREKREKDRDSGKPTTRTGARQDEYAKHRERQEAEQKRRDAERTRWMKALPKILEAVAARVKTMPAKATGFLADLVVQECKSYGQNLAKVAEYVPRGKSAEDVLRFSAFLVLCNKANDYNSSEMFPKLVKSFGVDATKILDEAAPKEKPKKAEAEQLDTCGVCNTAGVDLKKHICSPSAMRKAKKKSAKKAVKAAGKNGRRKKAA